jgi:hypothetical protein
MEIKNTLPLITDENEITAENSPEMYAELCGGCEDGEVCDHE